MDVIDISELFDKFIPFVIQIGYLRFLVIEDSKDYVIGILLVKDLLRYYAGEEEFNVRDMLRLAVFIFESKRLNVLFKDFRANRNYMAIVVDEYGGVVGLVMIEGVIEQIVGDIEDEYDFDEIADDIIVDKSGVWCVKAVIEIVKFNEVFGIVFSDEDNDIIGGLVLARVGCMFKRGEQLSFDSLNFKVLCADSCRLYLLLVEKKAGAK